MRANPATITALILMALFIGGCGFAGRTVTISVEREVDGVQQPLLEGQQVVVFPYDVWDGQRERAEARLVAIEGRLDQLLDELERDDDPTEEKLKLVAAAFADLQLFVEECGFVVTAPDVEAGSASRSFTRGGLASRLERRKEKVELIQWFRSQTSELRRRRRDFITLSAMEDPPVTFVTNELGYVTVPMEVFKSERETDGKNPKADAMRQKWILAVVLRAAGTGDMPSFASVVVGREPEAKYRLVLRQPDL